MTVVASLTVRGGEIMTSHLGNHAWVDPKGTPSADEPRRPTLASALEIIEHYRARRITSGEALTMLLETMAETEALEVYYRYVDPAGEGSLH